MTSGLLLHQSGFVPANARRLARASADAYQVAQASCLCAGAPREPAPGGRLADRQDACPTLPLYDAATDTHATVTRYDDCTVIAFRGTRDLANWLTDAEFLREHIPTGGVHRGFLAAVDSVLPQIKAALAEGRGQRTEVRDQKSEVGGPSASCPLTSDLRPLTSDLRPLPSDLCPLPSDLRPLILTGHSLGGALAVLAGYFLAEQNYPVHSIYTYGQPRAGDAAFAADFEVLCGGKTYRVVNQNDLVPRLPGWLLGYRHAGQLQFLTAFGQLVPDAPPWVMLLSDALGLWQAWRRKRDVLLTDHFIEQYIERLGAADAETSNSKLHTSI
jgi:hypothetical protein